MHMMEDPSALRHPLGPLPAWESVLAVVAHPDDESFGLGAVLDSFVQGGATVSVLCFTHGEASTLDTAVGKLAELRASELQNAAQHLGASSAHLLDYPDGALSQVETAKLSVDVRHELGMHPVEGMVVFDPSGVSGHSDHRAATEAALNAAIHENLPVLGWTLPHAVAEQLNEEFAASFVGHADSEVDLVIAVERERQQLASLAHVSQAVPTSVLWRRLQLLGDREYLRWLRQ